METKLNYVRMMFYYDTYTYRDVYVYIHETYSNELNTYLSLIYGNPVRCREPLVIFYVVHAVLQVAKPLCQVNLEQISQEIF